MLKFIEKFWKNSPQHNFRTIIKKILGKDQFYFSVEEIITSLSINKINANQLIDRYERYKRVTYNNIKLESDIFNFENKSILEIGSGPLLGIAPLAHFYNCKEFLFYEPNFNTEILKSYSIRDKYFYPAYKELCANYGQKIQFDEFYNRIQDKTINLKILKTSKNVDLIYSNSALEHIPRSIINQVLKNINKTTNNKTYFFHSVDFSSHNVSSLASIYSSEKNKDLKNINKLRKSEIIAEINSSGFEVLETVTYKYHNFERDSVHKSWRKYSDDDLRSMIVFFIGKSNNVSNSLNDNS